MDKAAMLRAKMKMFNQSDATIVSIPSTFGPVSIHHLSSWRWPPSWKIQPIFFQAKVNSDL